MWVVVCWCGEVVVVYYIRVGMLEFAGSVAQCCWVADVWSDSEG